MISRLPSCDGVDVASLFDKRSVGDHILLLRRTLPRYGVRTRLSLELKEEADESRRLDVARTTFDLIQDFKVEMPMSFTCFDFEMPQLTAGIAPRLSRVAGAKEAASNNADKPILAPRRIGDES